MIMKNTAYFSFESEHMLHIQKQLYKVVYLQDLERQKLL